MIESLLLEIKKYGRKTMTITQSRSSFGSYKYCPAFQDWINHLKKGERLPRGRFFAGKKPGRRLVILDEFHEMHSSKILNEIFRVELNLTNCKTTKS